MRHLRSWARVLEDLQRGANAAAATNPTVAGRAGRQNPSSRTAAGRAANVSGDDGDGAREAEAQVQNQARPPRATSYFMSRGRSASNNRRRR